MGFHFQTFALPLFGAIKFCLRTQHKKMSVFLPKMNSSLTIDLSETVVKQSEKRISIFTEML
ncbi:hypothetical protein BH10ACI3_BH10ACI3_11670 [soil metagenome]